MSSLPSPVSLSRRTVLKQLGAGLLGASALGAPTFAAEAVAAAVAPKTKAKPALEPLNRLPQMMQEYHVARLREQVRFANQRRAALRTKADAEAYVRDVRQKIQTAFGPWPEKTPLNARITGRLDRDTYTVEKIIFESRPGFLVAANLYLPKGLRGPAPGVLHVCGHFENGKVSDIHQSQAQGLARQGYVSLIFDPIGQGERIQHLDANGKQRHAANVNQHIYVGNRQHLTGDFLGTWFTWDSIRALDYLLSRPEVDPRQVGVTGNSGGGMQTTWLCGVEPRFTMAAPCCFVTTYLRNLENENASDSEQCIPRVLALGLDESDFIAAFAPKPVILLGQEKDFFDARGIEETYARLKHLYGLLGAGENVQLFVGADYHGYSQPNREAMYGWFNRVTGLSQSQAEPPLTIEKDETLWCTATGNVSELQSRTVFDLGRERSATLRRSRVPLGGAELRRAIVEKLALPPRESVPDYRILRPALNRGYPMPQAGNYVVETEPGAAAFVYRLDEHSLVSRPPRGLKRAVLYVAHRSADADLRDEPLLAELVRAEPQSAIFACDPRGVGESQPNTTGRDLLFPYGSDYFYASHGVMFGYSYPAQRTHDLLRVIDWLGFYGHTEVHLVAKGWGTVPATFAAMLAPSVVQVTLKHPLNSFAATMENEDYIAPLSSFVPGILQSFDLPDCYRELAAKNLKLIEPGDGFDSSVKG